MDQLTTVQELLRLPSPAPAPQALACDGEHLWMGSWDTQRIYAIDPQHFTVYEENNAPGKPVGAVHLGDELRFVCSEEDDHRFVRRYVPGHGFKDHEKMACPDDTGSFLAYDGKCLWLSQRHAKRILELDSDGRVLRSISAPAEIIGIHWEVDYLYMSLWYGKDSGCKLARIRADGSSFEELAALPFAAISLTNDGTRFWTNDKKANEIVAFVL